MANATIYKGVTITMESKTSYTFIIGNIKYGNTNLHMAKRMVTKGLAHFQEFPEYFNK
jgi:hypothetical protein